MTEGWLAKQFPRDFVGYAAEIGAYDGVTGSTTWNLELAGWTALCVEANMELEEAIQPKRALYRMCACGSEYQESADFHIYMPGCAGYSSLKPTLDHPVWHPEPDGEWKIIQTPVRTLDSLLDEVGFPRLDALSVDVEGTEMDVFKGFSIDRWRPQAIISESWDENGPVVQFLIEHGYRTEGREPPNDFFLRVD